MPVSNRNPSASLKFEPRVTYRVLRGCSAIVNGERCGEKHPLAHNIPINTMVCPKCGAPVDPPEPTVEVEPTFGERVYNILRSLVS